MCIELLWICQCLVVRTIQTVINSFKLLSRAYERFTENSDKCANKWKNPVERALLINDYKFMIQFRAPVVSFRASSDSVWVYVFLCGYSSFVYCECWLSIWTHIHFSYRIPLKKGSIWQPPLLFQQLCQVFKYEILPESQASTKEPPPIHIPVRTTVVALRYDADGFLT